MYFGTFVPIIVTQISYCQHKSCSYKIGSTLAACIFSVSLYSLRLKIRTLCKQISYFDVLTKLNNFNRDNRFVLIVNFHNRFDKALTKKSL